VSTCSVVGLHTPFNRYVNDDGDMAVSASVKPTYLRLDKSQFSQGSKYSTGIQSLTNGREGEVFDQPV
jgi:hypothetical protein